MTREEQIEVYAKFAADLIKAHVRGSEALMAVDEAGNDWVNAAKGLTKAFEDVDDKDVIGPDDQYKAFERACEIAEVPVDHEALEVYRRAFKRTTDNDARAALSRFL